MIISPSEAAVAKALPRRSIWRWLGIVALVVIALIGTRIATARSFDFGEMQPPLKQSGALPVIMPDGRKALLRELVRPGVPTVVTLWASWCGPCIIEAPKIAELRRRFGADRLNIVSLNVRDEDALREMRAEFMLNAGLPPEAYAILASDQIRALTNSDDVLIPRTLVFDRSGTPLAKITGYKPLALDRVAGLVGP